MNCKPQLDTDTVRLRLKSRCLHWLNGISTYLHPVVADVGDLESVVEEYVGLVLVVVVVDDFEVLLGDAPGGLVLVHPVDGLEHVHHLRPRLVPHGGARVDLGDGVGGPLLGRVRVARLRVDGDGLVVLREVVLIQRLRDE